MNKSKDATKETQETIEITSFSVKNARVVGEKKNVIADLVINGITIYGVWVVEGSKGDFLSFPSRKGADGKYYSIVWLRLSESDEKEILGAIEAKLNS